VATLLPLGAGDEAELEAFLVAHADSSLFLRENLRRGLVDRGDPLQGTWIAARGTGGETIAVASHNRKGNVMMQGPVDIVGEVARAAVAESGRAVRGLFGPRALVVAAREALGFADRSTQLDSCEDLMALPLADLCVPPPLADGRWMCRHPIASDRLDLARWSYGYAVEALGYVASPEEEQRVLSEFEPDPSTWVLAVEGKPVARSTFSGQLPDTVQVGGVYTPPELRRRSYGRGVVAGSLLDAQVRGVTRAVLFTANPAARAAYLGLGFRVVGDYGIVLFSE
jgi:RimJ/RimL family protein N-acetyltransferase